MPERKAFSRPKDNSKFYNNRKWRKVSTAYREAHPLCEQCTRDGNVGHADVCDHIDGLDNLLNAGRDAYDEQHLQSLCLQQSLTCQDLLYASCRLRRHGLVQ